MFENMMYFYSTQFILLKKLLRKKNIKEIHMNFSIPKFNKDTFRKHNSLDSSIIFDMGCYPFSLVSYFGFNKNTYKIQYTTKNKKINYIEILFRSKKIKFKITLAIYVAYKNYVKVIYKNNSYYQLNHFFYGKKI